MKDSTLISAIGRTYDPGGDIDRMKKGFSLIELLVVITILLIMLGIGLPQFRDFGSSVKLNSQARKIAGVVKYAYNQAATTGRIHRLNYDLEKQYYWLTYKDESGIFTEAEDILAKKRKITKGIRLKDILRPEIKINQGITVIILFRFLLILSLQRQNFIRDIPR